jgi:hypothetical protein
MSRINTLILAVSLILAAFANGGVYQITSAGSGGSNEDTGYVVTYRLNRFTGEVMEIDGNRMVEVKLPYRRPWWDDFFGKEEPVPPMPPPPVVPR